MPLQGPAAFAGRGCGGRREQRSHPGPTEPERVGTPAVSPVSEACPVPGPSGPGKGVVRQVHSRSAPAENSRNGAVRVVRGTADGLTATSSVAFGADDLGAPATDAYFGA